MKHLVIVESPTKAKTISKFLKKDYIVESSFGHVRDLPKSKLGVDVEKNFEPTYAIPLKAKKVVTGLKKLAKKTDYIYFATDEDREGEAISWHLHEILDPKKDRVKRITFHEITREAIEHALENPRDINLNLVHAQQARRVLDRLVGYKLSPLLWKKIMRGLSAGRVQSVAVRLIVEREREIQAFQTQEYWTIDAVFSKNGNSFEAKLSKISGKTLEKFSIENDADAKNIINNISGKKFSVEKIEKKKIKKFPHPPFSTSTLQQAAINRLGFSAKQTMMLAQQLYEGIELGELGSVGLITYMRTDSLNLSEKFLGAASAYITKNFSGKYYGGKKIYKSRAKNIQEAHEAIRPTDIELSPEQIQRYLEPRQFKLYDLIWRRALASQMVNAEILATTVDISDKKQNFVFRSSGSIIAFDGYLRVYPRDTKENILPELKENDSLELEKVAPNQHFTEPPARYSEATLVKALEEKGIGRPSTYAPIISTVQERNYVIKEGRHLKPTDIGILVNDLLVEHFPKVVDFDFTAKMEDELDDIAQGKIQWHEVVHEFYDPFEKNLEEKERELSKKEITEEKTDEVCEKCGHPMVIKLGRFGKFLACSGYPECKNTKEISKDGKIVPEEAINEKCPECGKPLVKKHGRFGPFIACSGYPECKYIKKEPPKEYADCPKCGRGKIVAKRSRRGIFYACNKYPDCKNAYWSAPTGEKCPECSNLLLFGKNNAIVCSNKECKFTKEQ